MEYFTSLIKALFSYHLFFPSPAPSFFSLKLSDLEQLKPPHHHMAAIVCHGLQSSLESQLMESRIHSLRLPSPRSLTPQPIDLAFKTCFWESNSKPHSDENSCKTDIVQHNPDKGGWSSIQALPTGPKEHTYVPPQLKWSSLRLSPKSLELCTENLGNETGTDIIHNGIDLVSSSDCGGGGNLETREQRKSRQFLRAKKTKTQNFPPPLTTIRGSESALSI